MMSRCTPSAADSTKFHKMKAFDQPARFQRKPHVQYCICGPQKKYTSPAKQKYVAGAGFPNAGVCWWK
jgi:hypothetical protein